MDAKSLVFKVSSDFSDASKGLDSFVEKFSQLDTIGNNFAKRMADAIGSLGTGGNVPKINLGSLLPAKELDSQASSLKAKIEDLYSSLTKFEESAGNAKGQGAFFSTEIQSAQNMEAELQKLYVDITNVQVALSHMGTVGQINPQAFQSLSTALQAANKDITQVESSFAQISKYAGVRFFDPQQFSQDMSGVKQFSQTIAEVQANLDKLKSNPITNLVDAQGISAAQANIDRLQASLMKLIDQYAKTGDAEKFQSGLVGLQQQLTKTTESAEGQGNVMAALGMSMGELTPAVVALGVGFMGWFTIVSEGKQILEDALKVMTAWEVQAAHLQAQTGATAQATNQMMDSIRGLSAVTGVPTDQIAEGYRKAAAEGFNFADSQKVVAAGLQAAVAQGGDATQTITGLATVLHNYGAGADEAAIAQAAIYRGSQLAGVGVDQMTQQVARATGADAQYRASLNETIAMMAAYVKSGGDVSSAGNQIALMEAKMAELTPQAQKSIGAVNPDFLKDFTPEVLSQVGGFTKAMQDLSIVAQKDPEILREVFSVISSGGAALKISKDNLSDYMTIFNQLSDSGANVTRMQKDQNNTVSTLAVQWNILKANLAGIAQDFEIVLVPIDALIEKLNALLYTINSYAGGGGQVLKGIFDKNTEEIKQGLADMGNGVQAAMDGKIPDKVQQILDKQGKGTQDEVKKFFAENGPALASAMSTGGQTMEQQVAQAASTVAKGMEDSMKLLFDVQSFQMPEGASDGLLALAQGMKKIFDSFDVFFNDVNPVSADNQDKVAKAAADEVKALTDTASLFKDLPNIDIEDPKNKIGELAGQLRLIQSYVTSALAPTGSGDVGKSAQTAELSKNVSEEVKLLTDVASLFKDLPNVQIDSQTAGHITDAAKTAGQVAVAVGSALGDMDKSTKNAVQIAAPIAENVAKLVSLVKDVAGLYKDVTGVSFGDISKIVDQLSQTAVEIEKALESALGTDKDAATTAGTIAEQVGKMATALKDVAGIYKDTAGLDIGDISGTIDQLVKTAERIKDDMTQLGPLEQGAADGFGAMAETVGKQATGLKDVASLYKEMSGVSIDTPDEVVRTLVDKAKLIHDNLDTLGELDKNNADGYGNMAETVGKQATALKDVAGLYKEMNGVSIDTPDSIIQELAVKAGLIHDAVDPLGQLQKTDADGLSAMAETVGKQATALKDVAGLYKEMDGVDLGQPDSSIGKLAAHAKTVFDQVQSLGQLDKPTADGLQQMSGTIGSEATALKDVAALLKEMTQVDLTADPTNGIRHLIDIAIQIDEQWADYFNGPGAETKDFSKIAESIGREVQTVNDTATLLKSLNEISEPTPSIIGKIKAVVQVTEEVSDYLSEYLTDFNPDHKDFSSLATQVGDEVKAVTDTVKMIGDLQNLSPMNVGNLKGKLDEVIRVLKVAIDDFEQAMADETHDPKLADIAKDGEEVMKAIGESIKDINDLAVMPSFNEQTIKNSLDEIIRVMNATLVYFDKNLVDLAHGPETGKIAGDASAVMKAIGDALKVFQDLGSNKPMKIDTKGMANAIDSAIGALKYFMAAIEHSGIDAGEANRAAMFADDVSKVLDVIDKVNKRLGAMSFLSANPGALGSAKQSMDALRSVVQSMQSTPGSEEGVLAGLSQMQNMAPKIPPLSQQLPDLSAFNFNQLLGGGGSGAQPIGTPTLVQPATGSSSTGSNHIDIGTAADKLSKAADDLSKNNKSVLNVEIDLDGKTVGRSTGNELFNNQTLRAQVVPAQQGVS